MDQKRPAISPPWRALALEILMEHAGRLGPRSATFVMTVLDAPAIRPRRLGRLVRMAKRLDIHVDDQDALKAGAPAVEGRSERP